MIIFCSRFCLCNNNYYFTLWITWVSSEGTACLDDQNAKKKELNHNGWNDNEKLLGIWRLCGSSKGFLCWFFKELPIINANKVVGGSLVVSPSVCGRCDCECRRWCWDWERKSRQGEKSCFLGFSFEEELKSGLNPSFPCSPMNSLCWIL